MFNIDSLIFDVPYTLTYTGENMNEPWQLTCIVTFSLDEDGRIQADGTFKLRDYLTHVAGYQSYYYGYYNNDYAFHYISGDPVG